MTDHDDPADPTYLVWIGLASPRRPRPGCGLAGHDLECVGCGRRLYCREIADVCPDLADAISYARRTGLLGDAP